jgi:hypothetical protein
MEIEYSISEVEASVSADDLIKLANENSSLVAKWRLELISKKSNEEKNSY